MSDHSGHAFGAIMLQEPPPPPSRFLPRFKLQNLAGKVSTAVTGGMEALSAQTLFARQFDPP